MKTMNVFNDDSAGTVFLGMIRRHDGYNGSFCDVALVELDGGRLIEIHPHGWYTSILSEVIK